MLNFNFKTKLVCIILVFNMILVLLVSFLNYKWNTNQITQQTINQTQQIIEQLSVNIDNYMNELFRLTLAPYYNDEVMSALEPSKQSDLLSKKRNIEGFLSSAMILPRDEILRVYILTDSNIYSYTRTPYEMSDYDTYKEAAWYQEALLTTKPVFIPVYSEKVYGSKKTQIFSVARQIRSKENNDLTLGVIKVDSNYIGIKSICDKVRFENEGALYIVGQNNQVVYQKNELSTENLLEGIDLDSPNTSYITTLENKKYIVNTTSVESSGHKIIAVNSYDAITSAAKENRNRNIILVSVCIGISTLFLILFIRKFLSPLFEIITSMRIVQTGDLSVQAPVKNNDEIGYLAKAFNTMVLHLKTELDKNTLLIKEVYEAQYLHKESQFNALCSQIKPHFLYNTLNTISLLIKCDKKENAVLSIENLSFFLRGIMNSDKEIPLSAEVEIAEAYLDIQKERYGEKLSYSVEISPGLLSFKIPALTLQPIVENAVKHGCECKRECTFIQVFSVRNKGDLEIHVMDDGIGMDADTLKKLQEKLDGIDPCEDSPDSSVLQESGIGLINVHRRLKLKFGISSGLEIFSEIGHGTTVIIHISQTQEKESPCILS